MKTIIKTLALSLFVSTSFAATSLSVDSSKSKVEWFATKVTGAHNGKVEIKSGNLIMNGNSLEGGEFVIDMTKITCDDIESKEYNTKFVNHLHSDDFFSTSKFKTAKLVITNSRLGKGGHYDVFADLTIKGIKKPVIFRANVSKDGKVVTADAEIKFNRTHYDIKYKSGSFFQGLGDKLIHDDVKLKVKLTTK
ncbi:YceI family protein [Halobacteriovorax sp. HLS]|uniref:YceI family protein n=1 Tax=Halobacteriovorax sp. HLS TaxID=2234000 RepID=UPI000FD82786|nr:YceI family protein [Halobacteriovorax sp. HLS]